MGQKLLIHHLLQDSKTEWLGYVRHEFVEKLGNGTLSKAAFQYYLIQDYHFLINFARSYGLAGSLAKNLVDLKHACNAMEAILFTEIKLHLDYCKDWDLSADDITKVAIDPASRAYTDFIFSCATDQSLIKIYVAMAPCMLGYASIGLNLKLNAAPGSDYQTWINMYASEDFQKAAESESNYLDQLSGSANLSDQDYLELVTIFKTACQLEADFWQIALDF